MRSVRSSSSFSSWAPSPSSSRTFVTISLSTPFAPRRPISSCVVATHTTNIPTAAGREFGYGVMCLRSAGTASLDAYDVDSIDVVGDGDVAARLLDVARF